MVGLGLNLEESIGSQCQDHFVNFECRRDREVSVYTTHTSRSQSRSGSHLSHEENAKNMQREIDHLKRKLCHKRRRLVVIDVDQGLLLVSLFRMMRTTIMSTEIEIHLLRAWEMMQ